MRSCYYDNSYDFYYGYFILLLIDLLSSIPDEVITEAQQLIEEKFADPFLRDLPASLHLMPMRECKQSVPNGV